MQQLIDHGLAHSIATTRKTVSDFIHCHDLVQGLSMHPSFRIEWVQQYPDLGWNMVWVSRCVREIDIVIRHPDAGWVFGRGGLSSNPNFDISWLDRLPDKPWSFAACNGLSACRRLRQTWVRRHPGRPWQFGAYGISRYSRHVTARWLAEEPGRGWDPGEAGLVGNPAFDIGWVNALAAVPRAAWDWNAVQRHPNFRPRWAAQVPGERFSRWAISRNKFFRPDWTRNIDRRRAEAGNNPDNPDNKWPSPAYAAGNKYYRPAWSPPDARRLPEQFSMFALGSYVYFDISWIKRFPESIDEWDWGLHGISSHPNFCFRWLLRYPTKPWCFGAGGLSSQSNVDLSWILEKPNAGWCFKTLSEAPRLTLDWIRAFPRRAWDYCKLTSARNFSLSWVRAFPDRPWRVRRLRPVVTFAEDRRLVRKRRQKVGGLLARGLHPVAPWLAGLVWERLARRQHQNGPIIRIGGF